MGFLVIFEVTGAGKRLKANLTLERPMASMGTVMDDKPARTRKQFVAHVALQSFLFRGNHMRFLMVLEVTGTSERFEANFTLEWTIARVHPVMN